MRRDLHFREAQDQQVGRNEAGQRVATHKEAPYQFHMEPEEGNRSHHADDQQGLKPGVVGADAGVRGAPPLRAQDGVGRAKAVTEEWRFKDLVPDEAPQFRPSRQGENFAGVAGATRAVEDGP